MFFFFNEWQSSNLSKQSLSVSPTLPPPSVMTHKTVMKGGREMNVNVQ